MKPLLFPIADGRSKLDVAITAIRVAMGFRVRDRVHWVLSYRPESHGPMFNLDFAITDTLQWDTPNATQ